MDDGRFYKDLGLVIYDIFGRKIKEINVPGGQNEIQVDVENFGPGIYFAILKAGNQAIESRKFIIAR